MRFALVTLETPESRRHIQEHREDHGKIIAAWVGEQAQAGRLLGGEAFETEKVPPATVRFPDGSPVVTDGPATGDNETIGGYFIIQVADRAEAIEVAKTWPAGETIEIRPIWDAESG